jgi:hypothetical protein
MNKPVFPKPKCTAAPIERLGKATIGEDLARHVPDSSTGPLLRSQPLLDLPASSSVTSSRPPVSGIGSSKGRNQLIGAASALFPEFVTASTNLTKSNPGLESPIGDL